MFSTLGASRFSVLVLAVILSISINIQGESTPIGLLAAEGPLMVTQDITFPQMTNCGSILFSAAVTGPDGSSLVEDATVFGIVQKETGGTWATAQTVPMGWSQTNHVYMGLSSVITESGHYRAYVIAQKDIYDDGLSASEDFSVVDPNSDITADTKVDLNDFLILAQEWCRADCIDPGWCNQADINHSGSVGTDDLMILVEHWLESDMVYIPGGTFQMGDSLDGFTSSLPVHSVTLSPFYMGKYEITNGQYCDFLNSALSQGLITVTSGIVYKAGSGTTYPYCDTYQPTSYSRINWNGSTFTVRTKSGRSMANDPMVGVSWYGAVAYCNWRSQQEGKQACYNLTTWERDTSKKGYHLPTEAQWEYAARGGLSGKRFPWGDTITHNRANYWSYWSGGSPYYAYDVNTYSGYHPTWNDGFTPCTSPVGSFAANGFGLYDMAGNVWEWCNDWYGSSYYSSSPNSNPTGPTTGTYRVLRGGGWNGSAASCRVAFRYDLSPGFRSDGRGFRISLDY